MGFFSNLKNSLTGSWADVTLEPKDTVRGEKLDIKLTAKVKSDAIFVNRVYIVLDCDEKIAIKKYQIKPDDLDKLINSHSRKDPEAGDDSNSGISANHGKIDVSHSCSLYQKEFTLAENVELEKDGKYSYELAIDIPNELPPSFTSENCTIRWRAYGALDMKGNDPDSGWIEIKVK